MIRRVPLVMAVHRDIERPLRRAAAIMPAPIPVHALLGRVADVFRILASDEDVVDGRVGDEAVSYTHLTLPTILPV